jgi:hypothetical protein
MAVSPLELLIALFAFGIGAVVPIATLICVLLTYKKVANIEQTLYYRQEWTDDSGQEPGAYQS